MQIFLIAGSLHETIEHLHIWDHFISLLQSLTSCLLFKLLDYYIIYLTCYTSLYTRLITYGYTPIRVNPSLCFIKGQFSQVSLVDNHIYENAYLCGKDYIQCLHACHVLQWWKFPITSSQVRNLPEI